MMIIMRLSKKNQVKNERNNTKINLIILFAANLFLVNIKYTIKDVNKEKIIADLFAVKRIKA